MKTYPSIPSSSKASFFKGYIFEKLDGSNLRFEWSKKRGWYKFGTRHRLFDRTDPVFYSAIHIMDRQKDRFSGLESVFKSEKWDSVVCFFEFWGKESFAGIHSLEDEKFLTLFDVAPYKKGLLGSKEFISLFSSFEIPHCSGIMNYGPELIKSVYDGNFEGSSFEGIVAKTGEGHKLLMAKAKTKAWIDKVKSKYSREDAEKIINS